MPSIPRLRLKRPVKYTLFFVTTLMALVVATGAGVAYAYHNKYYPGTRVAGVSIGGLTREAAAKKLTDLSQRAIARKVTIALPDITQPKSDTTGLYPVQDIESTAADLGVTLNATTALDQAWAIGHERASFHWAGEVSHLFFIGGRSFTVTPVVDDNTLRGFVATQVVAKALSPQPAKIVVNGKDISISDEQPGLAVDGDGLVKQLAAALTGSLDGETLAFRIPATLSDSNVTHAVVQPFADTLNELGDTKVSLTADGVTLHPSRDELLQWFVPVQDDQGNVSLGLNTDRIGTYLQKNKQLDQTKSLASVAKAATGWLSGPVASTQITLALKPAPVVTAGSYQAGLFDGKYIYVNLAEQKAYRINGQAMEKVYQVSSGKWSTPTPRGTFHVASKVPRAYSSEFGLYMPWWENFLGTADNGTVLPTGSYGLHELPEWPNGYKEGEGHLGTPVSHGCVRFGVGDAKEVYDWTDIGTPVVIE